MASAFLEESEQEQDNKAQVFDLSGRLNSLLAIDGRSVHSSTPWMHAQASDTLISSLQDAEAYMTIHCLRTTKKGSPDETTIIWHTDIDKEATIPDGIIHIKGNGLSIQSTYLPLLNAPDEFAIVQAPQLLTKKNTVHAGHIAQLTQILQSRARVDHEKQAKDIRFYLMGEKILGPDALLTDIESMKDLLSLAVIHGRIDQLDVDALFGVAFKKLESPLAKVRMFFERLPKALALVAIMMAAQAMENLQEEIRKEQGDEWKSTGNHG